MPGVRITGIGSYVPDGAVVNAVLSEQMNKVLRGLADEGRIDPAALRGLECDPNWIVERTGIKERRIAAPEQATSDLAVMAIRQCLTRSRYWPMDGSALVVGTVMGDEPITPSTAARVQHGLSLPVRHPDGRLVDRMTCDTSSACTSFGAALFLMESLIRSGNRSGGVAVGADVGSRLANQRVRGIAPILADAGFAMSLEATKDPALDCFLPDGRSFFFGCDGGFAEEIICRAGGTRKPTTAEMRADPLNQDPYIFMNGNSVFRKIIRLVRDEVIGQALAKAGLTLADIGLFVLHQANLRMIEPITQALEIGEDRTFNNIQTRGNTISASVGLCLDDAQQQGVLKPGMTVMLIVFGGGFTWGTIILKWPELRA
ncbi:MAG: 3-oxoacyl-[acyl-carrier-protein] synthase III C-terminal domain-containing protein [Patescibacteria group bacterium]